MVAEIWGGIKKKKSATFTIFLQHFHNKSQCHCHNSIPLFFFLEMICAQNFYNIFTKNFKCQVVIVGLKK